MSPRATTNIIVALALVVMLLVVLVAVMATRPEACIETREVSSSQTGAEEARVVTLMETKRKECS